MARTLRGEYETRHPWPDDCFVQGGRAGLVIRQSDASTYRTAFVEAFPRSPDIFIRGEGPTMADAEDAAWAKFERYTACDHAAGFDPRTYRNGLGFCRTCGMPKSDAVDLVSIGSVCKVCGVGTYWCMVGDDLYCKDHAPTRAEQKALRAAAREAAGARGEAQPFRLAGVFEMLTDEADADES